MNRQSYTDRIRERKRQEIENNCILAISRTDFENPEMKEMFTRLSPESSDGIKAELLCGKAKDTFLEIQDQLISEFGNNAELEISDYFRVISKMGSNLLNLDEVNVPKIKSVAVVDNDGMVTSTTTGLRNITFRSDLNPIMGMAGGLGRMQSLEEQGRGEELDEALEEIFESKEDQLEAWYEKVEEELDLGMFEEPTDEEFMGVLQRRPDLMKELVDFGPEIFGQIEDKFKDF